MHALVDPRGGLTSVTFSLTVHVYRRTTTTASAKPPMVTACATTLQHQRRLQVTSQHQATSQLPVPNTLHLHLARYLLADPTGVPVTTRSSARVNGVPTSSAPSTRNVLEHTSALGWIELGLSWARLCLLVGVLVPTTKCRESIPLFLLELLSQCGWGLRGHFI